MYNIDLLSIFNANECEICDRSGLWEELEPESRPSFRPSSV